MSKKQNETTSSKNGHSKAKAGGRTRAADRQSDPRLPPVGSVITKLDRNGKVRCRCKVEKSGIRYKRTVFRSLSGAAMAAASDLGLGSSTQNGFVFWDLT